MALSLSESFIASRIFSICSENSSFVAFAGSLRFARVTNILISSLSISSIVIIFSLYDSDDYFFEVIENGSEAEFEKAVPMLFVRMMGSEKSL